MLCVSITIHEAPDVIENQIENINRFVPHNHIVLHLSFSGYKLLGEIKERIKKFKNVHLNPVLYPTFWGWMLHAHLANYRLVRKLGIDFDYFVLESSNSMFVRPGAGDYIKNFDFLSHSIHSDEYEGDKWGVHRAACNADESFRKMIKELNIRDIYGDRHEGIAYRRELMDEVVDIIQRYYQFEIGELRYAREEIYFSTLGRHLSSNYSRPITYRDWDTPRESVERIRREMTINDPAQRHVEFSKCFAVKPILRILNDPLRQYVTSLD